ncbi:MAG: 50S ribosomal protein L29 [Verrucomicrobia bacterium]|nr:50S ribosomal protein L29 [Verrucomicrobiota bacterium]MCH8528497.1 50S ribosomal protein L29 [Kiritimatiellia bacterium]
MSKAANIREMTTEELNAALSDASESLFKLKLQQKLGQLENKAKITETRREIARLKTIASERALTAGEAQ